jgi:hypothetical protein
MKAPPRPDPTSSIAIEGMGVREGERGSGNEEEEISERKR